MEQKRQKCITVVRSVSLYKRHCVFLLVSQKDRLDLHSFATSVSNVLVPCDSEDVGESIETKKRRGKPSVANRGGSSEEEPQPSSKKLRAVYEGRVPEESRYDQISHWPPMVEAMKRKRCRVCQKLTQNFCIKCNYPLFISHTRNFFYKFHNGNDSTLIRLPEKIGLNY